MEYGLVLARQTRLDAPGKLHRVMGRGILTRPQVGDFRVTSGVLRNKIDREDSLSRLAELCESGYLIVFYLKVH